MAGIGPMELVIVLVIALLILGPKRLPDAGRSLGRGMREFKGALTGGGHDDERDAPVAVLPEHSPEAAPVRPAA